jgi:hypothetical protein
LSQVDLEARTGPSLGLACQLASGVAAAEIAKILLGRGVVRAAPCYAQFDAYTGQLRQGRLRLGNRHPWQRLKRWYLRRHFLRNQASRSRHVEVVGVPGERIEHAAEN